MSANRFDLSVSNPGDVADVLMRAAQDYRESATELAAAWQDDGAGRAWIALANVLERAATSAAKAAAKYGF